jgi:phosphopentomutase
MRAFLIVLDSVGIGEAPDAADYGDVGAHTLPNISTHVGGLTLPTLQSLGLGCIPGLLPGGIPIQGVPPTATPLADYAAMRELSTGKDTTTGHWEIAGLLLEKGFTVFPPTPPSFPPELIEAFECKTGRRCIGNRAANGTEIIAELGEQQMNEGHWIVYTSADSVFQIAAHESTIPLDELYAACEVARRLCDVFPVGRVIARPYVGTPGAFERTEKRRDYSLPPPEPTILDRLQEHGIETITIGKLDDIFAHRGISRSIHVENNPDAQDALLELAGTQPQGFVFANLIDFDMLFGHRRNPEGYAGALAATDAFLADFIPRLRVGDLLMITADHGNDPTFKGTDHTREYVPLLVHGGSATGKSLGIREGYYDIAQSLAGYFQIPAIPNGISFL